MEMYCLSSKKALKKPKSLINIMKLPRYYAAYKIYSKLLNTQGKYRNLKRLSPLFKKSARYYEELIRISMDRKSWNEAIFHINNAINELDKTSVIPFFKLKAVCLESLGQIREIVKYLEVYAHLAPHDYQAYSKVENKYMHWMEWDEAVKNCKIYLEKYPKDSFINYQVGECYFKLKKFIDAENYYQEATKNLENSNNSQPTVSFTYYKLGLMQAYNNKTKIAERTFEVAVKTDNTLDSDRYGIGVLHEKFEQFNFAVEAFRHRLVQNEKDAKLSFKLGSLLDRMKKTEQAINYYKNALRIDKVLSPWHFALANCYEQLKDYENAAYWYESAIARQIKHRPTNYRRLANVLNKLGRNKEALKAYNEAELFNCPVNVKQDFYQNNINKLR